MTLEHRAGVRAVIRPPVYSTPYPDFVGKTCTIICLVGTDSRGNYYRVSIHDMNVTRTFYAAELDVTPVETKEEKAAKLKAELEKLEAEIKAEADEKARNDIKGQKAGTLIEIGVDDSTDYVVKVGPNKWHWFSKNGDPLGHTDTTTDQDVIYAIDLAKKYGYHEIFPATED